MIITKGYNKHITLLEDYRDWYDAALTLEEVVQKIETGILASMDGFKVKAFKTSETLATNNIYGLMLQWHDKDTFEENGIYPFFGYISTDATCTVTKCYMQQGLCKYNGNGIATIVNNFGVTKLSTQITVGSFVYSSYNNPTPRKTAFANTNTNPWCIYMPFHFIVTTSCFEQTNGYEFIAIGEGHPANARNTNYDYSNTRFRPAFFVGDLRNGITYEKERGIVILTQDTGYMYEKIFVGTELNPSVSNGLKHYGCDSADNVIRLRPIGANEYYIEGLYTDDMGLSATIRPSACITNRDSVKNLPPFGEDIFKKNVFKYDGKFYDVIPGGEINGSSSENGMSIIRESN